MKINFTGVNIGPIREAEIGIFTIPVMYTQVDPDIESIIPAPDNYPNTTIYSPIQFDNAITVTIYTPTAFDTTPAEVDILGGAHRINDPEIGDASEMYFERNYENYLRWNSPLPGAYVGYGHVLLYFKKSLLQGRGLEISWGDTVGSTPDADQVWVTITGGKLLPEDIPNNDYLWNVITEIPTLLVKQKGIGPGPHSVSVPVPDLSSIEEEQITLIIYFRDDFADPYDALIYYFRVFDPGGVVPSHDFEINKRWPYKTVDGTENDYGDLLIEGPAVWQYTPIDSWNIPYQVWQYTDIDSWDITPVVVPPAPASCQPGTAFVSTCPVGAVTIPEQITVTFTNLLGALAAYNNTPIVLTNTPGWNALGDRDLYGLSASGDCYWVADLGGGAHQAFFVSDSWSFLGAQSWFVQINDWHLGGFSANEEYLIDDFPNNGPGYDPCDPRGSITHYSGPSTSSTCVLSF